jgi:hypothetical protein
VSSAPPSNRPPMSRRRPRRPLDPPVLSRSIIAGTTKDPDRSAWLPGNAKKVYPSERWPTLAREAKAIGACDNTAHMPLLPR